MFSILMKISSCIYSHFIFNTQWNRKRVEILLHPFTSSCKIMDKDKCRIYRSSALCTLYGYTDMQH